MTTVTVNLDSLNEDQLAVLVHLVADGKSARIVERALFNLVGRKDGEKLIEAAQPVTLEALK